MRGEAREVGVDLSVRKYLWADSEENDRDLKALMEKGIAMERCFRELKELEEYLEEQRREANAQKYFLISSSRFGK